MAAAGDQQSWVPYVPTRDCSVGSCSIYCPQWCYIIFPPPPPAVFSGDGSGMAFSPFVIAIIGVLAGAFLLVCYYALFSKYCGSLDSLLRWLHSPGGSGRGLRGRDAAGQSRRHEEAWPGSPANGLDETLISKITIYKYRRGDGMAQGTDCAVCLGEFQEHDNLRLLPKCSHAFHLECIDTWLRSHSNCPLCRANIVPFNPPPKLEHGIEVEEAAIASEVVVVVEDEGPAESGSVSDAAKGDAIVEIRDEDSTEVSHCDRVSISDVLQMSMEDELLAAKEGGIWTGPGSSRRAAAAGDHHRKHMGLDCVISAVPMERTFSNGRLCLAARHARARNELPVEEASESEKCRSPIQTVCKSSLDSSLILI